jgi:hypothetical protein
MKMERVIVSVLHGATKDGAVVYLKSVVVEKVFVLVKK